MVRFICLLQAFTRLYPKKRPDTAQAEPDMTPVTVENYVDCLSLKLIPCSQEGKDLARREAKLIIRGNHADMGGGIGANGGIDIGKEENTSVAVSKKWVGGNEASRPESVTVQLLSNGVVIDTADLSAANNWAHSFEKLPTTDAEGDPYQYNVEELTVPGYSSRITGDSRNGFVITNTKTSSGGGGGGGGSSRNDYTSLTVNKTWTTTMDGNPGVCACRTAAGWPEIPDRGTQCRKQVDIHLEASE